MLNAFLMLFLVVALGALHDWNLDCATNGRGSINSMNFAELALLDAGYGYTFDNGKTFPLRGKGFKISKLSDFHLLYPKKYFA
jgi:glycerophosphoryl diester phosphodiesterase